MDLLRTSRPRIIDLTLTVSDRLPTFPGSPRAHTIPWSNLRTHGYNSELVALSTHTGTHVDAPYHFDSRGDTIDRIPASRLVRKATILHTKKRHQNITATQIESLERRTQKIEPDATVVFETGWSAVRSARYFERNPGLEQDAARLLVRRRINMVGIDSPSIDPGGAASFPAHRILARSHTIIVENLCNLGKVRGAHFEMAVFPLKLAGASGAPARAIAIC